MSETMKKTITDKCPCCSQLWTREIDVPKPKVGIEVYAIEDNKGRVDVTIELVRPMYQDKAGDVDVFESMSKAESDVVIALYAKKYLKDNTVLRVDSNYMDKYETHSRRHVLETSNVEKGLRSLRKAKRQSRRNRQIDG